MKVDDITIRIGIENKDEISQFMDDLKKKLDDVQPPQKKVHELINEADYIKELRSLCAELAKCLCDAVNELNETGNLLAHDPLMRSCTACIKQFQCSEVSDTPCDFEWTYTTAARHLVKKAKEMCNENKLQNTDK